MAKTLLPVKAGPDWMAQLPAYLTEVPLNMLAIPGSHNSYSYTIDPEEFPDRALDPIYRHCVSLIGDDLATAASHRWTVSQKLTLTEQLDSGVRYFELRVTARAHTEEIFFRNGPNIINALRDFNRWTDQHRKEVIILDFTETVQLSAAQHRRLLAVMTREMFGNKLLDYVGGVSGITLRNMWGIGAQIIVFYPKEFTFGYTSVWPSEYIGNANPQVQQARDLIDAFDMRSQHGRPSNTFFCWKGVLTPTIHLITGKLAGTLEDLARPATRATLNWTRNKDIRDCEINIIAADFVNTNFCTEVIRVNFFPTRQLMQYDFEKNSSCFLL